MERRRSVSFPVDEVAGWMVRAGNVAIVEPKRRGRPAGSKNKPKPPGFTKQIDESVTAKKQEHLAEVVAMRIGPPPKTLKEIGQHFGCTREYIRQLLNQPMDETTRAALNHVKYPNRPDRTGEITLKPCHIRNYVKRWLAECGWGYCAFGKHVVDGAHQHACRECNTRRHAKWFKASPDAAEKLCAYRKAHPEIQRRASAKYQKTHPEAQQKAQQKRMARIRTDPVLLEKFRTYQRKKAAEYYARRKADPALWEKYLAEQRQKYHNKKMGAQG